MAKGSGVGRKSVPRRHHVLSFRVSDDDLMLIKRARGRKKMSKFLYEAVKGALPAPLPVAAASDHDGGGNG